MLANLVRTNIQRVLPVEVSLNYFHMNPNFRARTGSATVRVGLRYS